MGSSSPTNDPPTTTKGTDTQSQTTTTSTPPTASTTAATPLQIAMAAILRNLAECSLGMSFQSGADIGQECVGENVAEEGRKDGEIVDDDEVGSYV
mmetsp:Transcript_8453/g.17444  ORF Transcript_8453/g.17444 Transcript_8453/m.17444 type:complete len:96 (-) Transcript_8453:958-1245(-)